MTLLNYSLQSQSGPLRAGNKATLKLIASTGSESGAVLRIQLTLPVGVDSIDLIDGSAPISAQAPPSWTTQCSGGVLTFTCDRFNGSGVDPSLPSSLVFTIETIANARPGTATVTLVETSGSRVRRWGRQYEESAALSVDKFPATHSIPAASGTALLNYSLLAEPNPPQAGPVLAGNPMLLKLLVSNPGDDSITCNSIQVTLPVGDDASDLIDGSTGISTQPPSGWTPQPGGGGVVTFNAPGGGASVDVDGLVFLLATTANAEPGTASVTILETASDDGEPPPQQPGSVAFSVDKFPVDFSLSNLTAQQDNNIPYGQPALLTWTALGTGVSCTLAYQPSDSSGGDQISATVPNSPSGYYQTQPLTRDQNPNVLFTLTASVQVLGQDNPLIEKQEHTVTVDTVWVKTEVQPPVTGVNGLVMLTWTASSSADYCQLQDGTTLATAGSRYIVVNESQTFSVTAYGSGGQTAQSQSIVTVEPSIQPTEAGYITTASAGSGGVDGRAHLVPRSEGWVIDNPGGNGGNGAPATLTAALPPLDVSGSTARVIPISLIGGQGGPGGSASTSWADDAGTGGTGGNASLTMTFDPSQSPAAQYIIVLQAGAGGQGGSGGGGGPGSSGTVSATVSGQPLYLP